jgi:predicted regulator of Ras-like GTPase activity (Roadblock/LC7/MglB family)
MSPSKALKNVDRFQVSVDYLTEYSGVKGALISDSEGLVISRSGSKGFNAELYAATVLTLVKSLDQQLVKLVKPGTEYLTIKTRHDWITIAHSSSFYLIVAADRQADDLLNIRISRSMEMISTHLKNKYPALLLGKVGIAKAAKNMEEVHV